MTSRYKNFRARGEPTKHYAPSLFEGDFLSDTHERVQHFVAGVPGKLQPADQLKLYEMAFFAKGPVLEVGRAQGKSTSILAMAVRDSGSGVPMYSIDVSDRSAVAADSNLRALGLRELVTFVQGDSADAIVQIGQTFDLVFLDGDHSYPGVRRDLEALDGRIAPGGSVMFHDYFDARNQDPENADYGVVEAAEELAGQLSLEFRGGYGAIALFERTP